VPGELNYFIDKIQMVKKFWLISFFMKNMKNIEYIKDGGFPAQGSPPNAGNPENS